MIYQNISSKQIISKFFRDTKASISLEGDAIEWMAEALDHIGITPRLIDKKRILKISNYSARLPEDISQIEFCYYNPIATAETEEYEYNLVLKNESSDYSRSAHLKLINRIEDFNGINEFYKVEPSYLKTSFTDGFVLVLYKGYPVDSEGYPFVPDHVTVKEALTWFIQYKLAMTGWNHPAGINVFEIEQRWLKYCSQARVKIKLPDNEEYRKLFDSWVRLIPKNDNPLDFSYISEDDGIQEYINNVQEYVKTVTLSNLNHQH